MPHATGALHPALELGDLLLRGGVRCSVFKAVQPYAVIDTPDTADALLRAVTAQDSNAGFRALAAKLAPKHARARSVSPALRQLALTALAACSSLSSLSLSVRGFVGFLPSHTASPIPLRLRRSLSSSK